ncbi:SIS domain-containing protein [Virgibacillus dokdonensis]|uniref:Glutamine--fructose-6-phosphate aminotransferase [isomerizing] n=1 Tax=Virgibacillus dokdonensis TaxID=302167 RepID=A0A2K9IXV7_9BACI|nr:SIS domain-containing protein [Virgibacillus dokdonensis]AUJ23613.1 Glutamine--fructose-6-phosphate aminotransferase [Virgibacillus dokdonensis]
MESRKSHPYYMYEEIMLQPEYVKKLFLSLKFQNHRSVLDVLKKSKRIFLIGCGTSYHVALSSFNISQTMFKEKNKFRSIPAFELMSPNYSLNEEDVVIAFSHSGDTKATFDCIYLANKNNCKTVVVTGDTASRCADISDFVLTYGYKDDKSLAHTITYTLSTFLMLILMGRLARDMGDLAINDIVNSVASQLPSLFTNVLNRKNEMKELADDLKSDFFVVCGNENTIGVAHETTLKFGEVHYTPTTSMDVEQLFHGPLVMCNKDTAIIVIASNPNLKERVSDLFKASKLIGSTSLLFTSEKNDITNADYVFSLPSCHELLVPLLYVLPMQLLSYYLAVGKKLNPDHIRRDQLAYKKAREAYE